MQTEQVRREATSAAELLARSAFELAMAWSGPSVEEVSAVVFQARAPKFLFVPSDLVDEHA